MAGYLIFIIFISLSVQGLASSNGCSDELEKFLAAQKSPVAHNKEAWIKQPSPNENEDVFRLPTNQFGAWVEVHLFKNKEPIIFTITNQKVLKNHFDLKCQVQTSEDKGFDFSKSHADASMTFLTDEKLMKMLISKKRTLIYIWSPEMVYSAENLPKYKKTAEELKIDFLPVLDPRANTNDHISQAKLYKFEKTKHKLNSVELFMRNATLHFPTVFLIRNQKLSDFRISGVYDQLRFKKELKKELEN